ncbi:MAG: hypothetical protein ACOC59_00850 [Bacteroidota bacterium]
MSKKLAERYWEKLNLSEKEVFRYFGYLSEAEVVTYSKRRYSKLNCLLGERKKECLYTLKFFGLIGKTECAASRKKISPINR